MYTEIIIYTVVQFTNVKSNHNLTGRNYNFVKHARMRTTGVLRDNQKISWHEEQWETKREDALHSGIMSWRNISILND